MDVCSVDYTDGSSAINHAGNVWRTFAAMTTFAAGRVDEGCREGSISREGCTRFIQRHEVAWEPVMGALALVWVGTGSRLTRSARGCALIAITRYFLSQ
jgi:hypothetical protein